MGTLQRFTAPSWLSGSRTDVPTEPLSHRSLDTAEYGMCFLWTLSCFACVIKRDNWEGLVSGLGGAGSSIVSGGAVSVGAGLSADSPL